MLGASTQPTGLMNHGPGDMGTDQVLKSPLEDARLRASADHFSKGESELTQASAYPLEK